MAGTALALRWCSEKSHSYSQGSRAAAPHFKHTLPWHPLDMKGSGHPGMSCVMWASDSASEEEEKGVAGGQICGLG